MLLRSNLTLCLVPHLISQPCLTVLFGSLLEQRAAEDASAGVLVLPSSCRDPTVTSCTTPFSIQYDGASVTNDGNA